MSQFFVASSGGSSSTNVVKFLSAEVDLTTAGTTIIGSVPANIMVTNFFLKGNNLSGSTTAEGSCGFNGPSYDDFFSPENFSLDANGYVYNISDFADKLNTVPSSNDIVFNVTTPSGEATALAQVYIFYIEI